MRAAMRKAERTRALYAGSFDPITRGHLDIIGKALMTFDAVHVAIGTNFRKQRAFGVDIAWLVMPAVQAAFAARRAGG